jgi:DNA-binding Lrp family transcriptional regulator
MDEKDMLIVEELRKNGREPTKAIAERLDIPRATVHERIRRMVKTGIIKRFTAQIDYGKLDLGTTAFILLSFTSRTSASQEGLAKEISKIPNVFEVHIISGEWDLLVKARARSVEELGNLVVNRLRGLDGVEKTLTCFVFESIKEVM